jgi:hypothetical protein
VVLKVLDHGPSRAVGTEARGRELAELPLSLFYLVFPLFAVCDPSAHFVVFVSHRTLSKKANNYLIQNPR